MNLNSIPAPTNPQALLMTMFSENTEHCLKTGEARIAPQTTLISPGASEKKFSNWVEILIHKSLGLSEAAMFANWSYKSFERADKLLKTTLEGLDEATKAKFEEFSSRFEQIGEYTDNARKVALEARENVRNFLLTLYKHSATRVMDNEV